MTSRAFSLRRLICPLTMAMIAASCAGVLRADPPPIPPIRAERIPEAPPSRVTQIWQPGHWE